MSKSDAFRVAYGRRDDNEEEIISFLRKNGIWVIKMLHTAGFDALMFHPNYGLIALEIKNPTRSWDLTSNEIEVRSLLGQSYLVVDRVEQLADYLGIPYQEKFTDGL